MRLKEGRYCQILGGVRDLEFIKKQSIYEETLGKIHGSSNVKTFIVCTKRNNDLSDPNFYKSISKEQRVLIIGWTPFHSCSPGLTNKRPEFDSEYQI